MVETHDFEATWKLLAALTEHEKLELIHGMKLLLGYRLGAVDGLGLASDLVQGKDRRKILEKALEVASVPHELFRDELVAAPGRPQPEEGSRRLREALLRAVEAQSRETVETSPTREE